jgi:RimJ/RimL family protein N-acetyltransferase
MNGSMSSSAAGPPRSPDCATVTPGSWLAPHSGEVWLNWIVRRRSDTQPIGTVQATLTTRDGQSTATAAWVIGVDWQNQGFASGAARALIEWLWQHGADEVIACIHLDHQASAVVATRAGLRRTDEQRDGEQVWRASDGGVTELRRTAKTGTIEDGPQGVMVALG